MELYVISKYLRWASGRDSEGGTFQNTGTDPYDYGQGELQTLCPVLRRYAPPLTLTIARTYSSRTHGSVCWWARARFFCGRWAYKSCSAYALAKYTSPAGLTSLVVMFAPIPQELILATMSSGPALERSIWPAQIYANRRNRPLKHK